MENKDPSIDLTELTEADRLLPSANIIRIIRQSLPAGCMVSGEAKGTMLEAATELIGFITNHSIEEYMSKGKRKTLLHDDILNSLNDLDLNIYLPPLNAYLVQRNNRKGPLRKWSKRKKQIDNNDANKDKADKDSHNDTEQNTMQSEI